MHREDGISKGVVLVVGLALIAGAVGGIIIARNLSEPTERVVRRVLSSLGVKHTAKEVKINATRRFPTSPPQIRKELDEKPLNEEEEEPTTVDPEAAPVASSSVPASAIQSLVGTPGVPTDFALFRHTMVDRGHASYTAEPHIASKGTRVFVTWNWGAALSSDGGQKFLFINPYTKLPRASGGFCCDQLAYYSPVHDVWIWILQYSRDSKGNNTLRLAAAQGDANFDAARFRYWDLTAQEFGVPTPMASGTWLDNPKISATDEHLFITVHSYPGARDQTSYRGSLVIRFPMHEVAAGQRLTWRYIQTNLKTAAPVNGATSTMYLASHISTSSLRVWRWPDVQESPTTLDVSHRAYPSNKLTGNTCPRREGSRSGDWCVRPNAIGFPVNDDRVTTGWVARGAIGFAWNASQDPEGGFPYPFVMVVRIDEASMTLKDEPFIWSPDYALQYPAMAPNARGDLGGVVLGGGGDRYMSCVAMIRDATSEITGSGWQLALVDESDSDPAEPRAGDYLGAVPDRPGSNAWVGSCMTLHGGSGKGNVEIRSVWFGRAQDRPS